MQANTHAIAAYVAANTPIGTRYAVVAVPGTELTDDSAPRCLECDGEGRTPNGSGCGDAAGGWADTCDACHGTGKDMRGCEWCGITHDMQRCPEIKARLMEVK